MRTTSHYRRTRGFTLIELTVTLSLMGVIMAAVYTVLHGTLREKQNVELMVQSTRIGPMLLDQIERDLRQLYTYNIAHGAIFKGEDHRISGSEADKLVFVAQTPSTSAMVEDKKAVYSQVNEVGYALTSAPENPDFMVLWRREDYRVDDEPLKGGKGTPLYRKVTRFNVTYYDRLGEDGEDFDSWESEVKHKLPAAIEIELKLEVEPRTNHLTAQELERRTYTFRRWITFPEAMELTMAVRPAVPLPPGEDQGVGGPGKKRDGQGDGEGDGEGGTTTTFQGAGGSGGGSGSGWPFGGGFGGGSGGSGGGGHSGGGGGGSVGGADGGKK